MHDEDKTWVSTKVDLIGLAIGGVLALVMNYAMLNGPLLPTDGRR